VEIKVNLPFYTQFMIIFLPSIVSIIIIVGFIIYRRKHRRKMYQIRRNELYITGQTASDAILKIDHTLHDYFTQTQNNEINKKGGNENQ